MSAQQVRGMETFDQVGCTACHSGPVFAGPALPTGQPFLMRFPTYTDNEYVEKYDLLADNGRMNTTLLEQDAHMWRVPTLRNLTETAPYLHNGAVKTIPEAVRVMAATQFNKQLTSEQVADISAFLATLTGEFPVQTMPRLPSTPGNLIHD